jgi:hypothetical protein
VALDDDFLHVAAIHRAHELAENDFRLAAVLLAEYAEYNEENQHQDKPERDMF